MPTIRTYDTPALGIRPTETGIAATERAARRVEGEYREAAAAIEGTGQRFGQAIKTVGDIAVGFIEHREISAGAANFAEMSNRLTQAWTERAKAADPNDPTVAAKFNAEVVEPTLSRYGEGFLTEGGQRWATNHVNSLRQHMFTKTSADMSTLAGHAAVVNQHRTINSLSATVHSDPSSLDYSLGVLESSTAGVVGSSPNLSATDAARVNNDLLQRGKEAIIKSAALGHIEKTGEMPDWISDPKYSGYVNGAELKQFATYAKAQQRANQLTEKQLDLYHNQQATRAGKDAIAKITLDNVSFDENGKATVKPGYFQALMDEAKKHTDRNGNPLSEVVDSAKVRINWAQQQQREKRELIITDPAVRSELYDGLFRTDKPTTDVDIYRAAAERKIDPHDTSVLLGLQRALEQTPLKGPIYHDTMAAVKGILGDGEKGHEAYAKFVQSFIPEYLKQSRAGTLPANALDLRDDNSLISQSLKQYRLTPQEKMIDRLNKNLGGVLEVGGSPLVLPSTEPRPAWVPPDARQGPDGGWYVTRDGKTMKVTRKPQ